MTIKKKQTKKQGAPKRKRGRPTVYSHVKAQKIIDLLIEGQSLNEIFAREDMPDRRTYFRWLDTKEDFCHQLARVKENVTSYEIDACKDIIKGVLGGQYEPQQGKVAIDSTISLAKLKYPKKYSKDYVEHSADQNRPPEFRITVKKPK